MGFLVLNGVSGIKWGTEILRDLIGLKNPYRNT